MKDRSGSEDEDEDEDEDQKQNGSSLPTPNSWIGPSKKKNETVFFSGSLFHENKPNERKGNTEKNKEKNKEIDNKPNERKGNTERRTVRLDKLWGTLRPLCEIPLFKLSNSNFQNQNSNSKSKTSTPKCRFILFIGLGLHSE